MKHYNENNINNIEKVKTLEIENKKLKDEVTKLKEKLKNYEFILNNDVSKIDPIENINKKINSIDFYDVVIDIKSIKDINKGWEIKMSQKAEREYENLKKDKIIKIGVIGNSNKGKSFILSKISKIKLPVGTSVRTEGLSIKYPELKEYENRKIVLLDSCGLETPVLKNNINIVGNKDIKGENKEDCNKEEKNKDNQDNIIKNNENNEKKEDKNEIKEGENEIQNDKNKIDKIKKETKNFKELFKEKSREKIITELFLQNYIINNSDILIIVVGILTYSEQKLLNRIKTEIQRAKINKAIFIIHNLITYISIKQVEEYIKDYLLNSATFNLQKGHKISTKKEEKKGINYYEKNIVQKYII